MGAEEKIMSDIFLCQPVLKHRTLFGERGKKYYKVRKLQRSAGMRKSQATSTIEPWATWFKKIQGWVGINRRWPLMIRKRLWQIIIQRFEHICNIFLQDNTECQIVLLYPVSSHSLPFVCYLYLNKLRELNPQRRSTVSQRRYLRIRNHYAVKHCIV